MSLNNHHMENRAFLGLLLFVSLAFLWVLLPFFAPIFWAYALTLIFFPLQKRYLSRLGDRPNIKALITLLVGSVIIIIPIVFIAVSFTNQLTDLIQSIQSGDIDFQRYIDPINEHVPTLDGWLAQIGSSVDGVRERLVLGAKELGESLPRYGFSIGQNAFSFALNFFLMLYLAFFFLRDGEKIIEMFIAAFPMHDDTERTLIDKISEVTLATIKGNFVVACVQGTLGGLIFLVLGIGGALLWGVAMVLASLLPAVGAALIWAPVAIYLLATGSIIKGTFLIAFGVGIIGLVDNFLRPKLVGRDTGLPDYIILLSTLGGISLFGIDGFIVGPLIAALFVACWQIFSAREEPQQEVPEQEIDQIEEEPSAEIDDRQS
ncbi:MAG: AI-2E family transporter [Acidiferrobacterales bacterium]|nr:AI-2E family transporter [Acidiferrobacterales bacterium]